MKPPPWRRTQRTRRRTRDSCARRTPTGTVRWRTRSPTSSTWGQGTAVILDRTRTGTGQTITPKKHASCPGHAAYLDEDGTPVYVCTNPEENGHTVPGAHNRPM